jgi:putative flippase GtrA
LEANVIDTSEVYYNIELSGDTQDKKQMRPPLRKRWPDQLVRFGIVGILNTTLDLLILNSLLWLFPTTNTQLVLLFNSLAYGIGAINSFLLNKYWTFRQHRSITVGEVGRFALTTLLGIGCNDCLIWLANMLFRSFISQDTLWMNASKLIAIAGTVFISYIGMRLWVFAKRPHHTSWQAHLSQQTSTHTSTKFTK